ncbi:dihydropteroate synthase [Microbacterium sp. DT81.1]|uniref:dihydropteroate synthase n=1 Tax=Microbacterium sp. DT81.1 TaxID=3393413 RepID=UPI003CF8B46B
MTALIMGIVNATPDSFSDGGSFDGPADAIAHGRLLRSQGASIIDIGGESTRPGAERVPVEVELQRVLPIVAALAADEVTVSIDTMNARTALAAVEAGASIVNDVSGGLADPELLGAVAETGADIVLGHWRGPSADMYARAEYVQIGREVAGELLERVQAAQAAGIPPSRIVVDPGIGFAKNAEQNWALLESIGDIVALGHRVLLGTSRKRFLGDVLGPEASIERRDFATAVTSVLADAAGVWVVRVHDVASTRDALGVAGAWKSGARGLP